MKISSITLNCFKIDEMRLFYTLLGAVFKSYQITLGSKAYRSDFQGLEVNLIPAEKIFSGLVNAQMKLSVPAYQMTLIVPKMHALYDQVRTRYPECILSDIIEDPQGNFFLLEDPQGNKVQLIELNSV